MSGGAYNYLCHRDIVDMFRSHTDAGSMRDRLAALGYAEDAAAETEELILIIKQATVRIEKRMDRLHDVWRAVEWWDSGDYKEDEVKSALAEYRGEKE